MPISLSSSFNPGDLDTTTYSQLKIVSTHVHPGHQLIILECQYGNTVDDRWVQGVAPIKTIEIRNADFQSITEVDPEGDLTVYGAVQKVLYQYILGKAIVLGTIT